MIRLSAIIVTLFLSSALLKAQSNKADSLKKLLAISLDDSVKVEINQQLSWHYVWSWPDSSLTFSTEALAIAKTLNLKRQQVDLLCLLGFAYSQMGNFSIGLEKTFEALEIATQVNNPSLMSYVCSSIATVYFHAGDYKNALNYLFRSKRLKSDVELNSSYVTLGLLGETHFHLNQFDSAAYYIRQSYEILKKSRRRWSVPYLYLGKLSEREGRFSEALEFYRASVAQSSANADYIKGCLAIADVFKKTMQIDSSIHYSRLAYSTAKNTSIYIYSYEACDQLKQLYKNRNLDSAFKYQELMLTVKDNLYSREKLNEMQNVASKEKERLKEIEVAKAEFQNRLKMNAILGSAFTLFVIAVFLFRNNRLKQKAKQNVEKAYDQLKSTQTQLIQSEKMASLGELTAGIAHEIQNPLNFVNNFSEVNKELLAEMNEAISKGDINEAQSIAKDVIDNQEKINHHGKRADAIVKGMLQHSRTSSGVKEPTHINALADEYLRLAYHGLRAKDKSFNTNMKTDFDDTIGTINIIPQDIGRVVLNLITNAFYAVDEKKKKLLDGQAGYEPTVTVSTKRNRGFVEIKVKDNGSGISERVLDKIFQPFFTTKPTGKEQD